jgi:hypothetical protein
MSPRYEQSNALPRVRDGRRHELRQLLVSAANAARITRQNALGATLSRVSAKAVRDRVSIFLSTAR